MAKLVFTGSAGSVEQSKSLGFEIIDLVENKRGARVSFQNVTHNRAADISGYGKYREIGVDNYYFSGELDLQIPEHASEATVSVFGYIEKKNDDDKYELAQIVSGAFDLTEHQDLPKYEGQAYLVKNYIGLQDRTTLLVNTDPNARTVFSVNDKRIAVHANKDGKGSISFYGKDFAISGSPKAIQKFPLYAYTEKDNFTSPAFTGQFLNLLPDKIAALQACDVLNPPNECLDLSIEDQDYPEVGDASPAFEQPSSQVPLIDPEKCELEIDPLPVSACRMNSYAGTLLPNGQILYVFAAQEKPTEKNQSVETGKLNKIYLVNVNSSVKVGLYGGTGGVFNSLVTGVIQPSVNADQLTIQVSQELYDLVGDIAAGAIKSLVIFTSPFDGDTYQIIDKSTDTAGTSFFLTFQTNVILDTAIYCAQFVYVDTSCKDIQVSGLEGNDEFIQDIFGLQVTAANPTVTASPVIDPATFASHVYVVAQGLSDGVWQLFLYSIKYQINTGCHPAAAEDETFGWVQLTTEGENKNPIAVTDSLGNLHITWESDRAGQTQLYYGSLGPSAISSANGAVSSFLDKYAALTQQEDKPFTFFDAGFLRVEAPSIFFDPVYGLYHWVKFVNNDGDVTIPNDTSIDVTANATRDQAISFTSLSDESEFPWQQGLVDQLGYQVAFDLKNNNDIQSLSDATLDNLFGDWKDKYTVQYDSDLNNISSYTLGSNEFLIGRRDRIHERIIPIVGSYRNPRTRLLLQEGESITDETFHAVLNTEDHTVRHFVLALMPEKTQFKATNKQTLQQYADAQGLSLGDAAGEYVAEDNLLVNTGRYRLAILLNNNDFVGDAVKSNVGIVRKFSQPFDLITAKNFKVVVQYTKMYKDESAALRGLNVFSETDKNVVNFWCSITVLLNDEVVFAESFIADLSNRYRSFDIGFGIPGGGQHITSEFLPFESNIYDDLDVALTYRNIVIGDPSVILEPKYVNIPERLRSANNLSSLGDEEENEAVFFKDDFNLLNFGLSTVATSGDFPQIPITVSGINKSPAMASGFGTDIHLAWQSNRDKNWNIFYTSSFNKQVPFRSETQITSTESNSIHPSIAVSNTGARMIVWHDNRGGDSYQVYGATATSAALSGISDGLGGIGTVGNVVCADLGKKDSGVASDCELDFEFCFEGCCLASSNSSVSSSSSLSSSSSSSVSSSSSSVSSSSLSSSAVASPSPSPSPSASPSPSPSPS